MLTIDEVYTIAVEWHSLIDETMRQLFNARLSLGGIPVLIVGNPQQMIPVKGKYLYSISI